MTKSRRSYYLYAVDDQNQHIVVPVETKDLQNLIENKKVVGNTYLAVIDNLTTQFANKGELTASLLSTKQLITNNKIVDYYISYSKQKKNIKMKVLFNEDRQMVNKLSVVDASSANRMWVKRLVQDLIYNTCDNPVLKDNKWITYSESVMSNRSLLLDYLVSFGFLSGRYVRTSKLSIAENIDIIAEHKKIIPQYHDAPHQLGELQERINLTTDEIVTDISSSYKLARGIYLGIKKFREKHKNFDYISISGFDKENFKSPFVSFDMGEKTDEEKELDNYLKDDDFDLDLYPTFHTDGFDLRGIPTGIDALRGDYVEKVKSKGIETEPKQLTLSKTKIEDEEVEQLSLFTMFDNDSKKR